MTAPVYADSPIFVDSNVFLYALDEADPRKQQSARHWRAELWKSRRGRVSFQVLGEFYVNAVRKRPAGAEEALAEVRRRMSIYERAREVDHQAHPPRVDRARGRGLVRYLHQP